MTDPVANPPAEPTEPVVPPTDPIDPPADPITPPSGDWRESITDEKYRKHAERFDSIESLAKGNFEQRQKLSNAIVPPGKDATEDDVAAYRKAIGLPESVDKYEVQFGEGTDEAAADYWKGVFFENDVKPEVATRIAESFDKLMTESMEEKMADDKKYAEQSEADLRAQWEGPEYDKNIEFYKRAANELFGEDYETIRTMTDDGGRFIMDNPLMVKAFAKIGREMGEGRLGAMPVSQDDLQSMIGQADEFRAKANEAMAQGKHAEAKRWDQKESEVLARIPDNKE